MGYWKARHIVVFASREFRWITASNKKESAFKRRRPMPNIGCKMSGVRCRMFDEACWVSILVPWNRKVSDLPSDLNRAINVFFERV